MPAIHQLVSGFAYGDAISNEAVALQRIFKSWKLGCVLPEHRKRVRDICECAAAFAPDDIAVLHCSIGSPVNEAFAALSCRTVMICHNVTPSYYFDRVNRQTSFWLEKGRQRLARYRAQDVERTLRECLAPLL